MAFGIRQSIIITIFGLFFLRGVSPTRTSLIKEQVANFISQIGCSDGSKNTLFLNQYRAAKLFQKNNQKLKLFSTPLEIQHDYTPRTYLVYETDTEDQTVLEAQLNLLLGKMTDLKELVQSLGSDFSAVGVRHFHECFYLTTPSAEIKADVISLVALEVDRFARTLDPADPSLTAQDRLRLSRQLTLTFGHLNKKKVIPLELKAADVLIMEDEKRNQFPRLKINNLFPCSQDLSVKLGKELSALRKSDAYQFPPEFSRKFIFQKRFVNSLFNKSFIQWRLALLLSEVWGVDFKSFFETSMSCANYYVDWNCIAAFGLHVNNKIDQAVKNNSIKVNDWEPIEDFKTIMGSAVAILMEPEGKADFEQVAANMVLRK